MKRMLLVLGLIALAMAGCSRHTTVPTEPVYLHDTLHVFHNDTIKQMDSTIIERETIVREADSALLAAYGILGVKLQENEKAYLVLQRQMEQRLRELEEKSSDTVFSKVEVPVPTPVIQEVVKPMGWLNKTLRNLGIAAVIAALIYIGIKVWRKRFM